MISPIHQFNFSPEPFANEEVSIYFSEEDRQNDKYIRAKIGQIRKNVAIAFNDKNLYLVKIIPYKSSYSLITRYYGIIIFHKEKPEHWNNYENHEYKFYRTIRGYYVFTDTYMKSRCIPGKDDEYETCDIIIFDENGNSFYDPSNYYNSNTSAISSIQEFRNRYPGANFKDFFGIGEDLIDVAKGIVMLNNKFYDLESFNLLFQIPDKYEAKGSFNKGLLYLEMPKEKFEILGLVKNSKMVSQYSIEEKETIIKNLELEEQNYLNDIFGRKNVVCLDSSKINEKIIDSLSGILYFDDMRDNLRNNEEDYLYSSKKESIDFDNIIQLPKKCKDGINEIRSYFLKHPDFKSYNNFKRLFCVVPDVYCFINKDFILLCTYKKDLNSSFKRLVAFKIFNSEGDLVSNKMYYNLERPSKYSNDERRIQEFDSFTQSVYVGIEYGTNFKYVFGFWKNTFFETKLPDGFDVFYTSTEEPIIISENKEYFDLSLKPLNIKYVSCRLNTNIEKYLYSVEPNFYVDPKYYNWGTSAGSVNGSMATEYLDPQPTFFKDELCKPYPHSFMNCIHEMQSRNINRPNNIKDVRLLREFQTEEGKVYLYSFVCEPCAYCDLKGNILCDFDFNHIVL